MNQEFHVRLAIAKSRFVDGAQGFLCLHLDLPFPPYNDLDIRLHDGNWGESEEGWWSHVQIETTVWNCEANQFECRVHIQFADGADRLKFLQEKGWEAL